MNSNSFNNKKSLSQQDGCDDHTRREKPARAYNSNTMPQALPAGAACFHISSRSKNVSNQGCWSPGCVSAPDVYQWVIFYALQHIDGGVGAYSRHNQHHTDHIYIPTSSCEDWLNFLTDPVS